MFAKISKHFGTELQRSYALRFTDSLATNTLVFALPLMIYSATQSLAWSGAAFLIEWLPRLLSLPIAGPLVDRLGSRRIFTATNILRLIVVVVALIIITLQPGWWPMLIAVGVANGILGQLSFIAAEHLGVSVATTKSHHEIQSAQVSIDQTVTVLGPLLAGAMLVLHTQAVLIGVSLMTLMSILLARRLRQHIVSIATFSVTKGFRQGLSIIGQHKALQYVVLGTVAFNLLLAFITVMTPAIVKGQFHGNDSDVSILWTAGAIVSIISVGIASRVMTRTGVVVIGTISGIIASIAIMVASTAESLIIYAVSVALFIAMDGVYAVYIRTARARIVPVEHFGVTVSVIVLLSLIPFPLAGLLVAVTAPTTLPIILGLCTLVCFVITIISHLKIDASVFAPAK